MVWSPLDSDPISDQSPGLDRAEVFFGVPTVKYRKSVALNGDNNVNNKFLGENDENVDTIAKL